LSSEQKVEECDLASLKLREGAAQQQLSNALVLVTKNYELRIKIFFLPL